MKNFIFILIILFLSNCSCKSKKEVSYPSPVFIEECPDKPLPIDTQGVLQNYKMTINPKEIEIIMYKVDLGYAFQYEEPFINDETYPNKAKENYILKPNDFIITDFLLSEAIKKYNTYEAKDEMKSYITFGLTQNHKLSDYQIDIRNYNIQYLACRIDKNNFVYVNCFDKGWKKQEKNQLYSVDGGGKYFFHLVINLSDNLFYPLSVNSQL